MARRHNVGQQAFDAAAIYGKFQAFLHLVLGLFVAIPALIFGVWALSSGEEYRSTGIILVAIGSLIGIWVIVKAVLATKYKGFAAAAGAQNVLAGFGAGGVRNNYGPGDNLIGLLDFGFITN
jgi:hypothetical protein